MINVIKRRTENNMSKQYDYLIVGAGLCGAVFAREAVKAGKKVLLIDADSISVFDGSGQLCDEEFNMNERTQLITSAYRQDFGIFALFEYKEGEEGINGKPVIVGSVLQEDGSAEEVFFTKK